MRNTELIKLECEECGQRFTTDDEAKKHFHAINKLSDEPLTYLVLLPPNCQAGTMDAIKAFTKALYELQAKHKDQGVKFQLVPLSYLYATNSNPAYTTLESMLAVAI